METQVGLESGEASMIATSLLYPSTCAQRGLIPFSAPVLMDSCMLICCVIIDLVDNFDYIYGGSFVFHSDCINREYSI